MAVFHRLGTPTYPGGLPTGFDYINDPALNGDPGDPANADNKKGSGPNEGTYFVSFQEEATSSNANRANKALAQNCDFLDNCVSGAVPAETEVTGTVGVGGLATLVVTDVIFVGKYGCPTDQWQLDKLMQVLDQSTGNALITSAGVRICVSAIKNSGGSSNVVGTETSGFHTDVQVTFSSTIPEGTAYRLVYLKKGSLVEITAGTAESTGLLDSLVHSTLRTSAVVPAELMRFMAETSQRSGGGVTALACSILETPGIGGNILPVSNQLLLSIDPDNTAGPTGGGKLRTVFNKNGTPKYLFTVSEAVTAGDPSCWANETDPIRFRDPNVKNAEPTSGQYAIPLSSAVAADGDSYLRLGESPHSTASQPTILKTLNARHLTVGDGAETFGDFNGVDAVRDAILFHYAAGSGRSLHIWVKSGQYYANAIAIDNGDVVIEGLGPPGACQILNRGAGATNPCFSVGDESSPATYTLTLRNLGLYKSVTGHVGVSVPYGFLRLENCVFSNQYIWWVSQNEESSADDTDAVVARDCHFMGETDQPGALLLFTDYSATGFKFFNCQFNGGQATSSHSSPLVVKGATSGSPTFKGVLFDTCKFRLRSTTVSGGNPLGNPGVLHLDPNGFSTTVVDDVSYINCTVLANCSSGLNSMLMYLRSSDGTHYITVNKLVIKGGEWSCPAGSSSLAAFYVGGATYDAISYVQDVIVEAVKWGYRGSATYGVAPTQLGAGAWDFWGAFTINSNRLLRVRGVEFYPISKLSGVKTGDLYLIGAQQWEVDGISIPGGVAGTSGLAPKFRVMLDGYNTAEVSTPRVLASNIHIQTGGAACEPDEGDAVLCLCPSNVMTLVDCSLSDIGNINAYMLRQGVGTYASVTGLRLYRCKANGGACSFIYQGTNPPQRLRIQDCEFSVAAGSGIFINVGGTSVMKDVLITGNSIVGCGSGGSPGVNINAVWGAVEHSFVFTNNNIYDNNTSGAGVQVSFGQTGGPSSRGMPAGIILGNNLGSTGGGNEGQMRFFGISDNANQSLYCRGVETEYNVASSPMDIGHPITNSAARFLYNVGKALIVA